MNAVGVFYHRYRPMHIVIQSHDGSYWQSSIYFQPLSTKQMEVVNPQEITEDMLLPIPSYIWHFYGIDATWSLRLSHMMAMRGLNGVSLAKLAGVSKQQINAWVNGRTKPQNVNQQRLAAALQCKVEDLF